MEAARCPQGTSSPPAATVSLLHYHIEKLKKDQQKLLLDCSFHLNKIGVEIKQTNRLSSSVKDARGLPTCWAHNFLSDVGIYVFGGKRISHQI